MARIETWYRQDLKEPVKVNYLHGNVFSQDNQGNIIGVDVFDGGQPAVLSGTVTGYIIRADGVTVPVNGLLSGNKCSVILPETAYYVPGVISIIIKLSDSQATVTLCAVVSNVYQSTTDSAVDPGTIIPSIETLIETINNVVATIPPDYSDLAAAAYQNKNSASSLNSLGGIDTNSVYQVSTSLPDAPIGGSYVVITNLFTSDASIRTQMVISYSTNQVYYRRYQNSTWTTWIEITNLVNNGLLSDGSNLNDIAKQSIYGVSAGAQHIPQNYPADFGTHAGIIATVRLGGYSYNFFLQTAIDYATGAIRIRNRNSTGDWSGWMKPFYGYEIKGTLIAEDDLDDISDDSVYSVASNASPSNYPLGTRPGICITSKLFGITGYLEQIVLPYYVNNLGLAQRYACNACFRLMSNGTWGGWAFIKLTPRNHSGKYYAFGDSTTWGYSADQSHAQSPWNYPFIVGDLTGVEVYNLADPGQGLLKNWDTATAQDASVTGTINDMIENGDFDDTVLITVGWAYNDAAYYATVDFGDPTDAIPSSDTGITTWLGYYARVMAKLQNAAPNAMVVLVTGFGYTSDTAGHKTDEQWTKTRTFRDGDKTFKQMYDALEEMANYNGWYCINQAKGSAINRVNGSTIIGDNIHPTYDGYRLYGNFVASRIASIFQNV